MLIDLLAENAAHELPQDWDVSQYTLSDEVKVEKNLISIK